MLIKSIKKIFMKGSRQQETMQSKQGHTNKSIPEIRDNMDARHNKEDNKNNPQISREIKNLKNN